MLEGFSAVPPDRVPRRVFLFMPFALAGLAAIGLRREHPVPDPRARGSGAAIDIVVFSDNGSKREIVHVNKIVKNDGEWKSELTPEEFAVARKKGTERAFTGRYWNNHEAGMYRCVCCGTELFRSGEKFDSGTGWPSFTRPPPKRTSPRRRTAACSWSARKCCAPSATRTWASFSGWSGPHGRALLHQFGRAALRAGEIRGCSPPSRRDAEGNPRRTGVSRDFACSPLGWTLRRQRAQRMPAFVAAGILQAAGFQEE